MSCSALSNLDRGSEQWFRQRRIGNRARRDGWSEHHARANGFSRKHESSPRQCRADSQHCCAHAGYRSPDTWNRQSQPWNGSQHQWLYTAIAERHAGHNFTGVGNSWSDHPATRAAGAQRSATKQSATKQWHEWEPDGATFELVESRTRSSVQGVPLFCPNNSELLHKLQNDSDYVLFRLTLPSPEFEVALGLVPG
jgi:hypothetical protein